MIPGSGDLVERILKHFLQTHVHDVREDSPLRIASALSWSTGKLEHIAFRNQGLERGAEPLFQSFRVVLGDLQPVHDIRGDVATGAEQGAGVPNLPAVKDRDVGRPSTQLDDGTAQ